MSDQRIDVKSSNQATYIPPHVSGFLFFPIFKAMINFFRKTRKKLADDDRPLKYMRYAIGEIVLVVIGILIAISINNWNENRKLEIAKQNYYKQLLIDLDNEIVNINKHIALLNTAMTSYGDYVDYFNNNDLDPMQIVIALSKIDSSTKILVFNTNTIETLKSTGDIKLIPTSIRNKLIELNRSQKYQTKLDDRTLHSLRNQFEKANQST